MRPHVAIEGLWLAWAVSWFIAALWASRAEQRAGLRAQLAYRVVMVIGGVLFFIPAHGYRGPLRLWSVGWTGAWICVALMVAGFAFCWWARLYLGTLWSGSITKKADHHVVDTGPYALVRHPIYTGLLFALYATMIAKGTVLAVGGAAIVTLGLWMKARLEERFLRAQLGETAYDEYAARVPMLIPLL